MPDAAVVTGALSSSLRPGLRGNLVPCRGTARPTKPPGRRTLSPNAEFLIRNEDYEKLDLARRFKKPRPRSSPGNAEDRGRSQQQDQLFIERSDGHKVRIMVKPSDTIVSMKETIAMMLTVAPTRQLLTSYSGVQVDEQVERDDLGQRLRVPKWRDLGLPSESTLFLTDLTELRASLKPVSRVEKPELRGVTLCQLRQFLSFLKKRRHMKRGGIFAGWCEPDASSDSYQQVLTYDRFNHYHAAHWVIRPATASERCSFVEFLAPSREAVLRPLWFVSHAWSGETICDFARCLEVHASTRSLPKATAAYWASVFCCSQQELGLELQGDLLNCSFFRAIACTEGVLLLTGKDAVATTRTWCCFEIYATMTTKSKAPLLLDVATTVAERHAATSRIALLTDGLTRKEQEADANMGRGCGWRQKTEREALFPVEVMQLMLVTDVRSSSSSFSSERQRLLNAIVHRSRKHVDSEPNLEHREYDRINCQIRSAFAALGLGNALAQSSGVDRSLLAQLKHALKEDTRRRELHLNLMKCGSATGEFLSEIARELPIGLTDIQLHMMECVGFSDAGLAEFVQALPPSLTSFTLNIRGCRHIGDRWMVALGQAFQEEGRLQGLKRLELLFGATRVSDDGLAMLGKRFPPGLEVLELHLGKPLAAENEFYISDEGLGNLVRMLPSELVQLHLDLSNTNVTSRGLEQVALHAPRNLSMLKLNVFGTFVKPVDFRHAESLHRMMEWRSELVSGNLGKWHDNKPMRVQSSSADDANTTAAEGTNMLALSTRRLGRPEPIGYQIVKTVRRQSTIEFALPIAEDALEGSSSSSVSSSRTTQKDNMQAHANTLVLCAGEYTFTPPIHASILSSTGVNEDKPDDALLMIKSISERYVASLLCSCREAAESDCKADAVVLDPLRSSRGATSSTVSSGAVGSTPDFVGHLVRAISRNPGFIAQVLREEADQDENDGARVGEAGALAAEDSEEKAPSDLDACFSPEELSVIGDFASAPIDQALEHDVVHDDLSNVPREEAIVVHKPAEKVEQSGLIPLSKFHCSGYGVRTRAITPSTRSSTPASAPMRPSRPSSAPAYSCRPRPQSAITQRQRPHSAAQSVTPFAQRPSSARSNTSFAQRPTSARCRPSSVDRSIFVACPTAQKTRLLQDTASHSNRDTRAETASMVALQHLERIRQQRNREKDPIPHDHDIQRWCQEIKALSRFHRLDTRQLSPEYVHDLKFFYNRSRACNRARHTPGSRVADLQDLSSQIQSSTLAGSPSLALTDRGNAVRPEKLDESKTSTIDLEAMQTFRALNRRITQHFDELQPMDQIEVWGALCKNTIKDQKLMYTKTDIQSLTDVANDLDMSAEDAILCRAVFDGFDVDKTGFLNSREFEAVVVQLLSLQFPNQAVPLSHAKFVCRTFWRQRSTNHDDLGFTEFAAWYAEVLRNNFLVTESQRLQDIAAEYKLSTEFVVNFKRSYDSFCNDAGILDFAHFLELLPQILKVPSNLDIPQQRVKLFWTDLDPKGSGGIVFEQFLRWWLAWFYNGDEQSDTPPYETFYKLIRSVHLQKGGPPLCLVPARDQRSSIQTSS